MTTILSVCYAESADETIPLPRYATPEGSAGMDLHANFRTRFARIGGCVKTRHANRAYPHRFAIVAMPYDYGSNSASAFGVGPAIMGLPF